MAKKKRRRDFGTVLDFIAPEQMAKSQNIDLVSIWEIRPDPNQPRSLLPSELAQQFEASTLSPTDIIIKWAEYKTPAYKSLKTLAQSIAQHGQINPISVRIADNSDKVKYIIVTGERRWWSHVYMVSENRQINEGETSRSAEQIKVNITQKGVSIRAHQLIENLVREDLNVAEKAWGMQALRQELSLEPEELAPWKAVEESLGISKQHRIRITNVLKLTEEAIKLIESHNFSERMVRPITQKLRDEPDLQLQALNQLIAWQSEPEDNRSLIQGIKEYVDKLLAPEETEPEESHPWVTSEPEEVDSPPQITQDPEPEEGHPWVTSEPEETEETAIQTTSTSTQNQRPKQSFPSARTKVTRAKTLTDLIIMVNAAGGNVWQFDKPRYVKLSVMSEEGELKEYELPQPHEGILLSMFPRVSQG